MAELSGREDLRPQELEALGREPLLEESGGQRVRAPGTVGSALQRDQPPVGVHPSRVLPSTFPFAAQLTQ